MYIALHNMSQCNAHNNHLTLVELILFPQHPRQKNKMLMCKQEVT